MNTFGNIFQDLADQVRKSFFSRLGIPSFEMLHFFFAIPCPQVLTMIALFKTWLFQALAIELRHPIQFQDLAFQALAIELRHPIQFHDLAFQALAIEFVSVPRKG